MGLILSVLVACVGIAKFFEIYGDLTKRLELHPKNDVKPNKISNGDDLNQAKLPRIQLSRDVLSHEDIELECPTDLINRRSNSPRRFLITEKESHRSPSPARRFVVSEDVNDNSDVREFLVTQGVPKESPDTKRFILLDTKDNYRSNSPLPLPKQFIITEGDTQLTNKTLKSATEGIRIDVSSQSIENQNTESAVLPLSEVLFKTFVENLEHTLQVKNYANQAESNSLEPEYEEFHRSSSPYPDLGVKIRKSSTDLLENPMVSVEETDEDDYSDNSKSDTKIDVILHNKNYNTTEYWTNKIMVMPPKLLKKFGGEGSSLSKSSCDLANGCLKKSIRKTKTLDDLQKDSFDGLKLSIDGRKVIKRKKRGRSFNLDDRHFNTSGYKRLSSPTQKSPEDTDSSVN